MVSAPPPQIASELITSPVTSGTKPPPQISKDPFQPSTQFPQGIKEETAFTVNKPSGGGFYQQGLQPVKDMQQELIHLTKDIFAHALQFKDSADPFMNFLAKSMNKASVTGKQLVTGKPGQPIHADSKSQSGSATPNDNLKNVLSTISFIGSAQNPQKPDGMWGSKTDNAIRQVYSLGYALLQFQKQMGLQTQFGDKDLSEFASNIPKQKIDIHTQTELAPEITKSIHKIRNCYNEFENKILNNQDIAGVIGGEKALVQGGTNAPTLSKDLIDKSLQYKNRFMQISINDQSLSINPTDLESISNFTNWIKINFNSKELNNNTVKEMIDQVLNQLTTAHVSPAPSQNINDERENRTRSLEQMTGQVWARP